MEVFGTAFMAALLGEVRGRFPTLACQNHRPPSSTTTNFIFSTRAAHLVNCFGTASSTGAIGLAMFKFQMLA